MTSRMSASRWSPVVALVVASLAGCTRSGEAPPPPTAEVSSSSLLDTPPRRRPTTASALHARLANINLPQLSVTHGEIAASAATPGAAAALRVEHPAVRAVLREQTAQQIQLGFTYLGPTSSRVALGSGEVRTQIGAKLRAADGCNVVYAMLRIEPETSVVVQVKHNPGAHTHDDCGSGGYRTMKSVAEVASVPAITIGSTHRFLAAMEGKALRVWLDGALVWFGDVSDEAFTFDGPVGFRTDNGRFDVALAVPNQNL